MFGYVNINRRELKVRDYETYHAFYCGLCQMLKHRFGRKSQLLLNFDMTFLIILLTGLYELPGRRGSYLCGLHPTCRQELLVNEVTAYAADMSVLMAYENFMDDWRDERSYVKRSYAALLRRDYERVRRKYPRQAKALTLYLKQLDVFEHRKEASLDDAAGVTGAFLGEIFVWREDEWQDCLWRMGFYLGKFIYLMDAFEDMETDIKKGLYNPFVMLEYTKAEKEPACREILTGMMSQCSGAFERLPVLEYADILRNILYSGVWCRYECIVKRRASKRKDEELGR